MTLPRLLEKLTGFRAQKREATLTEYGQMVRHTVANKSIEPEKAAAILDSAGKSEADFAVDVALVQTRQRDATLVATYEATVATLRSTSRELDTENAAFSRRRDEHLATANRLTSAITKTRDTLAAIEEARTRLRDTADHQLKQDLRELAKQRAEQSRVVERRKAEVQEFRAKRTSEQQLLSKLTSSSATSIDSKSVGEVRSGITKLEASLAQLTTRLDQAIAAQKQLDADYDQVRDRMLIA